MATTLVAALAAKGYKTDLQYADDGIYPNQARPVENMVTKGAKVLVIASIDGTTLSNVLQKPLTRTSRWCWDFPRSTVGR